MLRNLLTMRMTMSRQALAPLAGMIGLLVPAGAQAQAVQTQKASFTVETVASGLEHPWGLAFLPDGRMLVTERPGRLRVVSPDGTRSPALSGLPAIAARGQGGLLDVALDPGFAGNSTIYLCYAEGRPGGGAGTSVLRARLNAARTALEAPNVIFRQQPAGNTGRHFGCRLVFGRDGNLFITLGDRGNMEERAQDPKGHIGKVVRIRSDGSVPADNPFADGAKGAAEVWSLGHRNVQGAALHPVTGELWTVEHGARGGDEINIPKKGLNYGWPVITYGIDYSGAKIGEGTRKEGMEQPAYYWDPSIAPSGAAFYTGEAFPGWRGDLLVGALAGQMLVRLDLDGTRIVAEERMLTRLNARIRDVRQGPDGLVYLLTDAGDGKLLRLRPAR
jgi:glucose/arabinose dehydrogenase